MAAMIPPRAEKQEMRALDAQQAATMLQAARGSEHETAVVTLLYTGLRLGELLGLRWQYLDLDSRRLSIQQSAQRATGIGVVFRLPKTHRSRRALTLPAVVAEKLRQHRATQLERRLLAGPAWHDTDLVFVDALGRPVNENGLR